MTDDGTRAFAARLVHRARVGSNDWVKEIFRMTRRRQVLGVTSLAVFMVFLDGTIVNVAFPALHQSVPSTSQGALSWVLNASSIVFAAMPTCVWHRSSLARRRSGVRPLISRDIRAAWAAPGRGDCGQRGPRSLQTPNPSPSAR